MTEYGKWINARFGPTLAAAVHEAIDKADEFNPAERTEGGA